jgi:hypothetical protein
MGRTLIACGSIAVTALAGLAYISQCDKQYITWSYVALIVIFAVALLICVVIAIIYLRKYMIYLTREYQKPPTRGSGVIVVGGIPPALRTGTKIILGTGNSKKWRFEYEEPIQAVRFIKPIEKYIWPTDHNSSVPCEHRILWRWRNKILDIPTPRIIVQFTETGKGITLIEENTYGVQVELELIPTPPQIKMSSPT